MPDNGRFLGLHRAMDKNNVTAPEYYSNDPGEVRESALLAPYLERVADVFATGSVDAVLEAFPEARVARMGNVVLYEGAPPMLDVRRVGDEVLLTGYYNEAVDERCLGDTGVLFSRLVGELRDRDAGA